MNLAIIHYHLRPGGVTEVIRNQLRGLSVTGSPRERTTVLVLAGEAGAADMADGVRESSRFKIMVQRLPELDYGQARPEPERLARRIRDAVTAAFGATARRLIHFHNHSLGKNYSVPGAVAALAADGERVLLHIHDFAEDMRPTDYARMLRHVGGGDAETLNQTLYPAYSNVHFAVLNQRDYNVLHGFGVQKERLHLLPNATRRLQPRRDPATCRRIVVQRIGRAGRRELSSGHRLFLYPARGIRRKNLGEALLWSALSPEDTWFGMSLRPRNPNQRFQYEFWGEAAQRLHLPFLFSLADVKGIRFLDYIAASHAVLNTSVAEGFGLVYLEAWTAFRPVVGRELPWVTADLKRHGMRLSHLYRRLWVPLRWVGERALKEKLHASLRAFSKSYHRPVPRRAAERAITANSTDGYVDFGLLDEGLQLKVLERVATSGRARRRVLEANPAISRAFARSPGQWRATTDHNHDIACTAYSIVGYGTRLRGIYDALAHAPKGACDPPGHAKAMYLVDAFHKPQDFRMLRS